MDERPQQVIVLGGGLAGLAAAWRLAQGGVRPVVLEREDLVGGFARTVSRGKFRFDLGAHRFHSHDQALLDEARALVGESFRLRPQRSRIFIGGKYAVYPFEMIDLLRAVHPFTAAKALADYLYVTQVRQRLSPKPDASFKDWFVNRFGTTIYEINSRPYVSKIYGMDPGLLSADWADQRVAAFNLAGVIKSMLTNRRKAHSEVENSAHYPDTEPFYYPDLGIGRLPERMAEEIASLGGQVITGASVQAVDLAQSGSVRVSFGRNQHQETVEGDLVVSTIPLPDLVAGLQPAPPPQIRKQAQRLRFRDIIFINLILNKNRISDDTWLYYPGPEVRFVRAFEFKNWSVMMAPEGKTSLCLDITCSRHDDLWRLPDAELVRLAVEDLARVRLATAADVEDSFVLRAEAAYPIYDLDYKENLLPVLSHVEGTKRILCAGRPGLFRYSNMDYTMQTGYEAARRILAGELGNLAWAQARD